MKPDDGPRRNMRTICINGNECKLVPYGYCACGCGNKTNICQHGDKKCNHIKGFHFKYLPSHHYKDMRGKNHPSWKGGTKQSVYLFVQSPQHPRADKKGYVQEHILIAEKALGKPLKLPHVVHHHTPDQLVICENQTYHNFLHQRKRALEACGHANWQKCPFCKQYADISELSWNKASRRYYHLSCCNLYRRNLYAAGRLKSSR